MWTTNYKLAGWIDMIFNIGIKQLCIFFIPGFNSWDQNIDHITLNFCQHFSFAVKIIVLGRYYDGINTYRLIVVIIFQGNLAFSIRTQVGHFRL